MRERNLRDCARPWAGRNARGPARSRPCRRVRRWSARAARRRVSSVTRAPSIGTFRSSRTSTRLPETSPMSSSVLKAVIPSPENPVPRSRRDRRPRSPRPRSRASSGRPAIRAGARALRPGATSSMRLHGSHSPVISNSAAPTRSRAPFTRGSAMPSTNRLTRRSDQRTGGSPSSTIAAFQSDSVIAVTCRLGSAPGLTAPRKSPAMPVVERRSMAWSIVSTTPRRTALPRNAEEPPRHGIRASSRSRRPYRPCGSRSPIHCRTS